MMKRFILIVLSAFAFVGCAKKPSVKIEQISDLADDHEWYFFTANGFERAALPQKSGISSLKPWTETLRISDANSSSMGNGYMVVNRLGVIYFEQGAAPLLIQDYGLFSNSTASTLVFNGENPYITFSRSSFFNKEASLESSAELNEEENGGRAFLVRISPKTRSLYPVITYGDLNLAGGGEITGTYFDGKEFLCSVKKVENSRTFFTYINFYSPQDLETLSPYTQAGKITIEKTSEDSYRKANSPSAFSAAPSRLKELLSSIPEGFDFSVCCKDSGGASPRLFSTSLDSSTLLEAYSIISDGWICAVFADGTTYFNGALAGRNILNEGKNIAFRLPKLPKNYIYGPFCISGSTLAVAWEESDFYKTGRSGFLTVDLGKVLYGDR